MSDGASPNIDRRLLNGNYDSSPLDLDGDGIADIDYDATKQNVIRIFDTLVTKNCSELFIYTIDHGGSYGGNNAFMCLWNGEIMHDYEFANQINKLSSNVLINIVMGQCNSGGFIDDLSGINRVITTACTVTESSWACTNGLYDEFIYHWTAAVNGSNTENLIINSDENNDNFVSMQEAYVYAVQRDTKSETPQISTSPLKHYLSLDGCFLQLFGTDQFCDTAVYSLENVPTGATITWSYTPNAVRRNALKIVDGWHEANVTVTRGVMWRSGGIVPPFNPGGGVAKAGQLVQIPYSGNATLTATVSLNGESYSVSKNIFVKPLNASEKPIIIGEYNSLWYIGVPKMLTVQNCESVSYDDLQWEIAIPGQTNHMFATGRSVNFTPNSAGNVVAVVTNNATCMPSSDTLIHAVRYQPIIRYTNPAKTASSIDIKVVEQTDEFATISTLYEGDYTLELWSERLGRLRKVDCTEAETQISLTGLDSGTYFIKLIIENEIITTEQLIIR